MSSRPSLQRSRWMAYALVGCGALLMLAPFYVMFVFATQSRTDIFSVPPPLWFGDDLLANLRLLGERIPFWRSVGWSLYVALMSTALTLLFCAMGGYAFAMFEFRFKRALFALVLGTMLLPSFMSMIPSFMVMDLLGWIDEPRALYLPGAANAFGIFLMRQYVRSAVPGSWSRPHAWTAAASSGSSCASCCRCSSRPWARWGSSASSAAGTTSWAR